jgi:predicted DNA-binding protein
MNEYRAAATGRFTSSPATKMKKIYSELYRAFDHFNKTFTNNKLPKPVITIQESGRKNAYGWFGKSFWVDKEMDENIPEINISAEYVARGAHAVLETLLHEMAHFYNAVNDIKDCSSGQYHNKHFKKAAELFGLSVNREGNRGYCRTNLTEVSEAAIDSLKVNESLFQNIRRRPIRAQREKKYISLVVSADIEDLLQRAINSAGMSQRQFVQSAIERSIHEVL